MEIKKEPVKLFTIFRAVSIVLIIGIATYVVITYGNSTINILVEKSNENLVVTTLVIFLLFFLKSISFGLPYTVLYIGVGQIYSLGWALLINSVGILINMQAPYIFGRKKGGSVVAKSVAKYPKLEIFLSFKSSSPLVFTFLVKFLGIVPHEITNLLLGSLAINYLSFNVGGVLGLLPGMVVTTIAGSSLSEPTSPQFIISAALFILLIVFSYYMLARLGKDKNKN